MSEPDELAPENPAAQAEDWIPGPVPAAPRGPPAHDEPPADAAEVALGEGSHYFLREGTSAGHDPLAGELDVEDVARGARRAAGPRARVLRRPRRRKELALGMHALPLFAAIGGGLLAGFLGRLALR